MEHSNDVCLVGTRKANIRDTCTCAYLYGLLGASVGGVRSCLAAAGVASAAQQSPSEGLIVEATLSLHKMGLVLYCTEVLVLSLRID